MTFRLDSYEAFTAHLEDREFFGAKLGLERMRGLCALLGSPQAAFPSVHIAGTNGKGSTAAFIASILGEAGIECGLYTSPHLLDFCERIRIGERPIRPDEVVRLVRRVREAEGERLTFFELATAIAFLFFSESPISLAILETGLGGRLDATNVVRPVVSVITSIGLDHTAHLGSELDQIAAEKGGIIKPGVPVVCGATGRAREILEKIAAEQGAPFHALTAPVSRFSIGLRGEHQKWNAAAALKVTRILVDQGLVSVPEEAVSKGLASVRWPGRMETIYSSPEVVLDGAHNPDAMMAAVQALKEIQGSRPVTALFGAMADKDWQGMLRILAPQADRFVFCRPALLRAEDPDRISSYARTLGRPVRAIPEIGRALDILMGEISSRDLLFVTGSLFTVGEARRWFNSLALA